VNRRSRRTTSLLAAVAAGALVTALLPGSGGADTAPSLHARGASLGRTEHAVLLELYALESSLAGARAQAAGLRAQSEALEERTAAARRSARIVRSGLALSRARVADLVRRIYVEGEADPFAILLGATSVDEALAGLDSLQRATDQNRRLAAELSGTLAGLRVAEARLAARRAELAGTLAAATGAGAALTERVAAKRAYLSSLRRERSVTDARLQALETRAVAAERSAARLVAAAAETPSSPAAKPLVDEDAAGPRTLVVDAVAYHLPGRTASGLPVGPGVVAVDPAVIPLGTRMFVPGYGPAIAADVGYAVKGAMIDLWFATTDAARAWGRRTVTITLYS
jgi:3D (Asp-Asp-Asp) domain-containing protein